MLRAYFISGQVRCGTIRRSSASARPSCDGTTSVAAWTTPTHATGPSHIYPPITSFWGYHEACPWHFGMEQRLGPRQYSIRWVGNSWRSRVTDRRSCRSRTMQELVITQPPWVTCPWTYSPTTGTQGYIATVLFRLLTCQYPHTFDGLLTHTIRPPDMYH